MTKKTSKQRRERLSAAEKEADQFIAEQIESIDEKVEQIEKRLRPYERLREKRDRLLRSRSALLGGTRLTGQGTARLTQERVVELVTDNQGSTAQELADMAGVTYHAMFGHLTRGRNERFLSDGKRWYLRDPKAGVNTIEDIEIEEDEE